MMNWINNKVYKATFKNGILLLGLLSFSIFVDAKAAFEKTKTVIEEFDVTNNSIVNLTHDRGLLNVIYYEGDKAKIETTLMVSGNDEADLEKLLSKYSLDIDESNNETTIKSSFHINQWNSMTWFVLWTAHKIKFDDGDQITSKVSKIKANLTLWIPMVSKLKLKTQYDNMQVGDLPFDVETVLHSGNLDIGNIDGHLTVDLKYGNANIGNLKQATLEIFEGKLFLKNGEAITLKSKYSDIQAENLTTLNLDIFEGKISFGNITETLDIKGKYAELKGTSIDKGVWDLFECKVQLDKANDINLKGKYGKHNINEVETLEVDVFETDFNIGTAGKIISNSDKYCEFNIELLKISFINHKSFEGKLIITELNNSFEGMEVSGKYVVIKLPLDQLNDFQLDVDSRYGRIEYEDLGLDFIKLIDKDDDLTLLAKSKNGGDNSPLIKIRGHEMTLKTSD